MHRVRIVLAAVIVTTLMTLSTGTQAASDFANSAFRSQWQAGEALTPNFWGPLETAKEGQPEPYKEATDGKRTVQYFDKGRMELTNGTVTNGLLATEIVTGRVQIGDNSFENRTPPNIAIAGDAENPAPTYAGLAGKGAALLHQASSTPGAPVGASINMDGDLSSGAGSSDPAMQIGAYDDATKHNVAAAFMQYRAKAGLATIGYAISEPFRASVKVGGQQRDVMVQIFERRALTYTASNPDAFKVEMGNIGLHYFRWRYPNGAPASAPPGAGAGQQTNVNGLIAFSFPNTWKMDTTRDPSGPPRLMLLGPTPSLKLVMQIDDQPNPPASLDSELAVFAGAARGKLMGGTTTDEAGLDTKIGGEPAKAYRISGTRQDGTPYSAIIVVVFHKGKEYTFIAQADASPMPNYDDINAILATMTFQS